MDNKNSIGLLIPAYNVEKYLPVLLDAAFKYFKAGKILVVNDGSIDNTAEIASTYEVGLISHENNLGKGAALMTGFDYFLKQGYDWIITIDGDLQHDPKLLPQFIRFAEKTDYDLVIGARNRKNSNMPWDRRFSNWSTSKILTLLNGKEIRDSQCGYRLIRCNKLTKINCDSNGYEFETECLLKMLHSGAKIAWIDIPTHYSGAPSSIKRFRDIVRFLKVVVKFVVERKKI
ncbi:glycosyltransferase family 2 protein [bacterium]|nr:glycosyltransferase family 2 protein [bacterium]